MTLVRASLAVLLLALLSVGLAGCRPETSAPGEADELPPVVRTAECRRATGVIKIDGVPDEAAWAKAQELRNFAVFWQKRPAKTATRAKLLWDDNYLYFAATMEDQDLYALVKERNGQTWNDDVFELFFKPDEGRLGYYEFQVNAAGTPLELYLPSRGAGGYTRFAAVSKLGLEAAVKLDGTLNDYSDRDKGWSVEGRIPWSGFEAAGGRPRAGAKWKFALGRYDYSVALESPELSSTAALTRPDFHHYEDYGTLVFVGAGK